MPPTSGFTERKPRSPSRTECWRAQTVLFMIINAFGTKGRRRCPAPQPSHLARRNRERTPDVSPDAQIRQLVRKRMRLDDDLGQTWATAAGDLAPLHRLFIGVDLGRVVHLGSGGRTQTGCLVSLRTWPEPG